MTTARLVVDHVDPVVEARVRYAFRAYAAVYGIRVVTGRSADVTVSYGAGDAAADVTLEPGYRARPLSRSAPRPIWVGGMPCFHPTPRGAPDVLGEVFEWLGAPHEVACTTPDDVGRVPPEDTLAGTHGIDRTVPWVNRWLATLHAAVRAVRPGVAATPPSPFGPGPTFVASHDLDHLSGARLVNLRRVRDNALIALFRRRDPSTTAQILIAAARRAAARKPVADGVRDLLLGERSRGVRATYTVIAESSHHRDPGYRLQDAYVTSTLAEIAGDGHELAVHGSYRSLESDDGLAHEYALMSRAGFSATGGRQHWLRHRGGELFRAAESAGALWDSTRGHPDDIGYRNGAAFPFAPYDFARERPHRIIEIPLVVMERALCSTGSDPDAWPETTLRTLHAAGPDGWGGTAILWHDSAFTGTALPGRLAQAYWDVLDHGDRWVTANQMAQASLARWTSAGAFD